MNDAVRLGAAILAAGVLAVTWRRAATLAVDATEERVFRAANRLPDAIHVPTWAVMQMGSFIAVFVVAGGLRRNGHEPEAVAALVVGTMVWAGVKRLKVLIGRGRPTAHLDAVQVRGQPQAGLGFPSGHAALSLTLALVVVSAAGPVVAVVALAAALFTGAARLYVGAHLPLDVVGGFAIGVIAGAVAVTGVTVLG